MKEKILILDFGSNCTQKIARKIRSIKVFAEIQPFNIDIAKIKEINPNGIILSDRSHQVLRENEFLLNKEIFELEIPILGIGYGMQFIAESFRAKTIIAEKSDTGVTEIKVLDKDDLFFGIANNITAKINPNFTLKEIPNDFESIAKNSDSSIAAIRSKNKMIYGIQFFIEDEPTESEAKLLENFARRICKCKEDWDEKTVIASQIKEIKDRVGNSKVICALSGGVDSTTLAVLLHKAIGEGLHCIHIDTGLMRKNESSTIIELFKESFHIPVEFIDASEMFLERLKGITNPETKRKIIGNTFIELFEEAAKKIDGAEFLAQGTLYPDVIESVSADGRSVKVKSHHNVGGLPEKMNFKLIEPFKELFKDEVRAIGRELKIPEPFTGRHPFPGPGLAVRLMAEITKERLDILREADDIFTQELRNFDLYNQIWQAFVVLLSEKTVGVSNGERTYQNVVAIRAVTSSDGMSADFFELPYPFLRKISNRIINEVQGINRVVYDISTKPPSTIEWE